MLNVIAPAVTGSASAASVAASRMVRFIRSSLGSCGLYVKKEERALLRPRAAGALAPRACRVRRHGADRGLGHGRRISSSGRLAQRANGGRWTHGARVGGRERVAGLEPRLPVRFG